MESGNLRLGHPNTHYSPQRGLTASRLGLRGIKSDLCLDLPAKTTKAAHFHAAPAGSLGLNLRCWLLVLRGVSWVSVGGGGWLELAGEGESYEIKVE